MTAWVSCMQSKPICRKLRETVQILIRSLSGEQGLLFQLAETFEVSYSFALFNKQIFNINVVMAAGAQQPDKSDFLHRYLDYIFKSLFQLKMLKVPTVSLMNGTTGSYLFGMIY